MHNSLFVLDSSSSSILRHIIEGPPVGVVVVADLNAFGGLCSKGQAPLNDTKITMLRFDPFTTLWNSTASTSSTLVPLQMTDVSSFLVSTS